MDDPVSGNVRNLTQREEEAARLVAADELSNDAIAAQLRITERTVRRWKRRPDFAARVAEHRKAWRDAIMREGIADRVQRIQALADRVGRLGRVIAARAIDAKFAAEPGGDTGLLTRSLRTVRGPDGKPAPIWQYVVDVALLRELREHEKQAAQELGQWVDKLQTDLRGEDLNQAIRQELARLSLPLMQQAIARAKARAQHGEAIDLDELAQDVDRELRRLVGLAEGDVPPASSNNSNTVH